MSDLPPLELQCFGVPRARLNGSPAPAELLRRKHLALLVYLALSPNRQRTRSHLVGLLWPETGEAQARHSLNEAIRRLRAHAGDARLASAGDAIVLREEGLQVDALRFDALVERHPADAARLVLGDFLEGFTVDGAAAFEEWAALERERYRTRAAAALLAMGEEALAAGRESTATESARRALALQPYAEPAAQLLMRARALAGDTTGAVATPLESDRDAPWSTLRTLLRTRLPRSPGSAAIDPSARAVLAALSPEAFPDSAARPPADHAEVAAALASLLRGLAGEQPVALAVDEAHCADGASIEALSGAMMQLAGVPLLLVLGARGTYQETARALIRFQGTVGRAGGVPGQAVQLEPLSAAETRELVLANSAWCVS